MGNASMVLSLRSGEYTRSVWMVLVTVLGTVLPRSSLPKGTHIYFPSFRGVVGSWGTWLNWVIIRSSRWWITSADRVRTRLPGYRPVRAVWSRWCPRRMAASTLGLRLRGS